MKYPAQSDLWRLDHIVRTKSIAGEDGQSRVLSRFRQVFPLTLFPGEIIIEELRIVWVRRSGPWTNEVISIMATDIACVNASSGPFFGQIHIKSLTGGPEIFIDNLFKSNVYKIRSLVEGIALASRERLRIEASDLEVERQSLLRAGSIVTG
jgi:hypothetical protein